MFSGQALGVLERTAKAALPGLEELAARTGLVAECVGFAKNLLPKLEKSASGMGRYFGWSSQSKLVGSLALIGGLGMLTSCNKSYTRNEATSRLQLLDVTSGGAGSGKYRSSRTTESYWKDPSAAGSLIRCYHYEETGNNPRSTGEAMSCESLPTPGQIPGYDLLAVNLGIGQLTQSVWWNKDLEKMQICTHKQKFFSGATGDIEKCEVLKPPAQLEPRARLESINSGSIVAAQSFWSVGDSLMVCDHEKKNTGFFLWSKSGFGKVKSCEPFSVPLLPAELHPFKFAAATSDNNRAWETFWQNSDGVLARCKHESTKNWFSDDRFGPATECSYWPAPDNQAPH